MNWLKVNNKFYVNIFVDLFEYDNYDRGFYNVYSLNEVFEVELYIAIFVNKIILIVNI